MDVQSEGGSASTLIESFKTFWFRIWKFMEGGLIKSFGSDARAAVMLPDDSKFDEDGVVMVADSVKRFCLRRRCCGGRNKLDRLSVASLIFRIDVPFEMRTVLSGIRLFNDTI
jgi:hypothetical protein